MYFSICKGCALLFLLLISAFTFSLNAQEIPNIQHKVNFNVQPQQCVTLRQGRDCFATIVIQWNTPVKKSLCLYQVNKQQDNSQKQLHCWMQKDNGQVDIEFESSVNLTYQLRTHASKKLLAETEVVVSWVHKNPSRKRRWRLF